MESHARRLPAQNLNGSGDFLAYPILLVKVRSLSSFRPVKSTGRQSGTAFPLDDEQGSSRFET
ncbi:hypothetical protein [Ammoniphilus sp. YIM 78166]|uniref:hypothetical protein n=1 Tax=Ammoniphilus sp. YIM 78166 TaxID=1644106 RepID=UPI00107049F3|nr:hypothetical protein [Ammoniphilus sp. YIM 78166]